MAAPGTRGGWGRGEAAGVTPLNFPSTKNPIPPRYCPLASTQFGQADSPRLASSDPAWHYPIVSTNSGSQSAPLGSLRISLALSHRFDPFGQVAKPESAAPRIDKERQWQPVQPGISQPSQGSCIPNWKKANGCYSVRNNRQSQEQLHSGLEKKLCAITRSQQSGSLHPCVPPKVNEKPIIMSAKQRKSAFSCTFSKNVQAMYKEMYKPKTPYLSISFNKNKYNLYICT